MDHVAFDVPPECFDEYVKELEDKGIETSAVSNHDDSEWTVAKETHDGVFIRSVCFFDPGRDPLELSCWTRALTEADVAHEPAPAVIPV